MKLLITSKRRLYNKIYMPLTCKKTRSAQQLDAVCGFSCV